MNERISSDKLIFDKLTKDYSSLITDFENEENDLVDFLKNDAFTNQEARISTTYLVFIKEQEPKPLTAYASLLTDSIRIRENQDLETRFKKKGVNYSYLPALKIGRMAVDKKYQGKGIGSAVIDFSIGIAMGLSSTVGCRFLIVDAKQNAKGFYEKHGFRVLKEKEGKPVPMFLDLCDLAIKE